MYKQMKAFVLDHPGNVAHSRSGLQPIQAFYVALRIAWPSARRLQLLTFDLRGFRGLRGKYSIGI